MKTVLKGVAFLATSTIAVPYAVALLANILYGWPRGKNKYHRALHPRKVYALNYTICLQLARIRYLPLLAKWKYFYHTADASRIVKDITFGNNENQLDLYFPESGSSEKLRPVVVFIYGGAWGSGNKSMYSLLCSQLADKLDAVVCCPNYSLYPKGYVDDMIQDTVDTLSWVHANSTYYGGDRDQVMMVGHSAGAQLMMMAVLELVMKQLTHEPTLVTSSLTESIRFDDKYFNGNSNNEEAEEEGAAKPSLSLPESSNAGSFYVVNGKEEKADSKDGDTESFIVVEEAEKVQEEEEQASLEGDAPEAPSTAPTEVAALEVAPPSDGPPLPTEGATAHEQSEVVRPSEDRSTLASKAWEQRKAELEEYIQSLPPAHREVAEVIASIKSMIGLAGVYHIGDHYDHETMRGVEDISDMAKAMYAPEHFDRFSPATLVKSLPPSCRLPALTLVHGTADVTVPLSSSTKFAEALEHTSTLVDMKVLPGLGHVDVVTDLMEPNRLFHNELMGIILEKRRALMQ